MFSLRKCMISYFLWGQTEKLNAFRNINSLNFFIHILISEALFLILILLNFLGDYLEASNIYEKPSPEETPFENQYAALNILTRVQSSLENELTDEGIIIKASLDHFIGKIHYSTEDRPSAVKSFQKCLLSLETYVFDNRVNLKLLGDNLIFLGDNHLYENH